MLQRKRLAAIGTILVLVPVTLQVLWLNQDALSLDIDARPIDDFGLTQSEIKSYHAFKIIPIPGTPYVYCEFHRGAYVWGGGDSDYDLDRIVVVVDTESGERVLRASWHDEQSWLWGGFRQYSHRTDCVPVFMSENVPALLMVVSSESRVMGFPRWTKQRYSVDMSGRVRKAPMEGSNGQSIAPGDFPDGALYDRLATMNRNREFAGIQPDPERLLFYESGRMGTIGRDGTGVKYTFPKPATKE